MENRLEIKRGDVWMVDLGEPRGHIQGNLRPVIIVSNDYCNLYSPIITIIPLSSNIFKKRLPTHVFLSHEQGLAKESIALCEQVQPVNKDKVKYKVAQVDEEALLKIEKASQIQLGIHTQDYSQILKKIIYLMQNIFELENYIGSKSNLNSYNVQLDMYKHEFEKTCLEIGISDLNILDGNSVGQHRLIV